MYAVINTMSATDNISIGHVISSHYTREKAEKAQERVQRQTRQANPGRGTYLPTRIVKVEGRPWKGKDLHHLDVVGE